MTILTIFAAIFVSVLPISLDAGDRVNLLKLGKSQRVKAGQESTTEPIATEATPPVEITAEGFALADDTNNDQYPTTKINIGGANEEYKVGDLIELWVEPFDEEPEDLESVNYTWTVLPTITNSIWSDNTRILFGALAVP